MNRLLLPLGILLPACSGWAQVPEPPFNPYAYSFDSRADSLRASQYWYSLAKHPEEYPDAPFNGSAVDALLRSGELDPSNEVVVRELATALFQAGRHKEALAWNERARQTSPDDIELWQQKAQSHEHLTQHDQALQAYRRVLRLAPGSSDLYRHIIQYHENLGRFVEAMELYHEAARIMPDSAWIWGGLGSVSCSFMQAPAEGLEFLEKAIALDPQDPGYRSNRATALGDMGRFDEALVEWDRAIELVTDNPESHSWLLLCKSLLLKQAGRYAEAEIALEEVLQEDPRNSIAWESLGQVRRWLGQPPAEQIEAFDQALAQNESDWRSWASKAESLRDWGRDDEALAAYDKALEINSLLSDLWLRKGWLLRKMQRYAEALECTQQAGRQPREGGYPVRPASILNLRCDALLGLRRYEEAIAVADSCLKLGSAFDNPHRVKGMALYHLGRAAEAEPLLERAGQLDKSDFENWRDLAIVQLALGKRRAALQSVKRAVDVNLEFRCMLAAEPGLQDLRSEPEFRILIDN